MNFSKRKNNEKKFKSWKTTGKGGRVYRIDVKGKFGWKARYLKEVDKEECTLRFWQEIFNHENKLVEVHEKFPIDKGHKKI